MAMTQQELRPQPAPTPPPDDDVDELYEEEPHRRAWGAIASVVLALALVFVGYQWHQASGRERELGTQVNALRADAETQRLRAEEAQRQVDGLQKQVAALTAERDALGERIAALEKTAARRPTAARAPARPGKSVTAAHAPARHRAPVSAKTAAKKPR